MQEGVEGPGRSCLGGDSRSLQFILKEEGKHWRVMSRDRPPESKISKWS